MVFAGNSEVLALLKFEREAELPGNVEATASGPSDLLRSVTLLTVAQPESFAASGIGRRCDSRLQGKGLVEGAVGTRKGRRLLWECRLGKLKGSLEFRLHTTPWGLPGRCRPPHCRLNRYHIQVADSPSQ